MQKHKRLTAFLVSALFAIILLYALFSHIPHTQLLAAVKTFNWHSVFLALCVLLTIMVLRALRFRYFLKKKLGFLQLLPIMFIHSFLSNNLPARLGELSYVYMVKESGKVPDGENMASLIIIRAFDFLMLAIFVPVALLFAGHSLTVNVPAMSIAIAGLLFIGTIFFLIMFGGEYLESILEWFLHIGNIRRFAFIRMISGKVNETVKAIRLARSEGMFFHLLGFSAAIWVCDFLFSWVLLLGSGINLGFFPAAIAISLPILASVLPIQPLGGFGAFEGSLSLGLLLFGLPAKISLTAGLLVHVETLLLSFVLAAIGYLLLLRERKANKQRDLPPQTVSAEM